MRRFTMLSLQSRFALPAVIGLVIALVVPASGQDISDLRRQREQARAAEQEALEQIDLLRADDALVAEVLAEIQSLVDAQTARVAGARQALAAAESEVLYREQLARDAEAAVAVMRKEIAVRAVDSYVGTDTSLEPWLESGDPQPHRDPARHARLRRRQRTRSPRRSPNGASGDGRKCPTR